MIEGLKIQISTDELKQHLESRAEYHREKTGWYRSQAESLKEGGVPPTLRSNNPVHSLESSAESHMERTAYFSFMAEHLIEGETYQLSQNDLGSIELASKYFPGIEAF